MNSAHCLLEKQCIRSNRTVFKNLCGWERFESHINNTELMSQYIIYKNQFILLLEQIDYTEKQIESLIIKDVKLLTMKELLYSIPGIGKHTANVLTGLISDIKRFKSEKQLTSYLGLAPIIRQSGEKSGNGFGISKRGNSLARGYLTQCAVAILHSKQLAAEPLQEWYYRIKIKKGWAKARIALARKLTAIAFGVLKSGKPFDMEKVTLK